MMGELEHYRQELEPHRMEQLVLHKMVLHILALVHNCYRLGLSLHHRTGGLEHYRLGPELHKMVQLELHRMVRLELHKMVRLELHKKEQLGQHSYQLGQPLFHKLGELGQHMLVQQVDCMLGVVEVGVE